MQGFPRRATEGHTFRDRETSGLSTHNVVFNRFVLIGKKDTNVCFYANNSRSYETITKLQIRCKTASPAKLDPVPSN